jgi:hypothetical protein
MMQQAAFALILFGVALSAAGALVFWQSLSQTRFHPIAATVLESGIGLTGSRYSGSSKASRYWELQVRYSYEVAGRRYESTFVSSKPIRAVADDGAKPTAELEAIAASFPVGATVRAWVAPDDPERVVLFPAEDAEWMLLAIGIAVLAVGIGVRVHSSS